MAAVKAGTASDPLNSKREQGDDRAEDEAQAEGGAGDAQAATCDSSRR